MNKLIHLLFAAALATGCNAGKASAEKPTLTGTWELQELQGQKRTTGKPVYIDLTADRKLTGFTGCNTVRGNYTADLTNNRLSLEGLASTRMTCPDQQVENDVTGALRKTAYFVLEDGILNLQSENRTTMAQFKKIDNPHVVNKYWKLTVLDSKPVTMEAAQEREAHFILKSDGSLSGFGGCNSFSGSYELKDSNRIDFDENMAVTMRACPELKLDERAFLNVFYNADSYVQDGDKLSLKKGSTTLAVFEAVYF